MTSFLDLMKLIWKWFDRLVKGVFILFLLALAGVGYFIWEAIFPTVYTQNLRVVITVNDNGRIVEGSSIISVSLARSIGMPYSMGLQGEAVSVDLGERGVLFATLRGSGGGYGFWERIPELKFGPLAKPRWYEPSNQKRDRIPEFKAVMGLPKGTSIDLPFDELPMLVRFRDINDPATVEKVAPPNLAARFGAGVQLARVRVELTDEPVTTGIEKRLKWLADGNPEARLNNSGEGRPIRDSPREYLLDHMSFWSNTKAK